MLSLLLCAATVLGFLSGSLWVFSATFGALLVLMYPITSVLVGLVALTYVAQRHYKRKP
jgi:hypothetical protein